ncbi:hypothetical protein TTHERM_00497809 (macronuclear) [Tetrahymena thermophila SB210]|uniref:Uncharacterized protein n=1 Tax=Tetrahymena thermophila (strain SB210) TaxID=312017 RepID=A4VCP3_TETTS|nr:hypothetical protein TTHERM_00497809 [Tetrahymena thermophila SB210]EDK31298.2 hypothetical protein TTHERM_00497809 [Tetrahymena thermophila SB210]|eukprot:XP_001471071.2 hypothetical protein TTHERM_00497809 [Tetrahymena thermophila SB210]
MTDFYNKYKQLFEGEAQVPSDFNFKSLPSVQYGGLNQNSKDYNIKEFKQLFDEEQYQPKKMQFDSGFKQNNYYQDSLDNAQLLQPKKIIQQDELTSFGSKKPPLNLGQKEYLNFEQFNKNIQYGQDQQRSNSRQSQKRDTLAANAERLLQQDYSSFNKNINSNRLNDYSLQYDNQTKNNIKDNFQQLNQNSAQRLSPNKPPYYMEKQESTYTRNKDNLYSPITSQQYSQGVAYQGMKNNNQAQFFSSSQDKFNSSNQKQMDVSPVTNMSKQRKYQDLYGNSVQYLDNKNQQRQQDRSDNIIQQQQQQSPQIPRQRGIGNQADNGPKQYYEERNQGLLDIIYLKKKFVDHKIITDVSGFPGQGQYKQALVNRIIASKNIEQRKDKLKQQYKTDRVF